MPKELKIKEHSFSSPYVKTEPTEVKMELIDVKREPTDEKITPPPTSPTSFPTASHLPSPPHTEAKKIESWEELDKMIKSLESFENTVIRGIYLFKIKEKDNVPYERKNNYIRLFLAPLVPEESQFFKKYASIFASSFKNDPKLTRKMLFRCTCWDLPENLPWKEGDVLSIVPRLDYPPKLYGDLLEFYTFPHLIKKF